jgi:hypothetical protein
MDMAVSKFLASNGNEESIIASSRKIDNVDSCSIYSELDCSFFAHTNIQANPPLILFQIKCDVKK